MTKVALVTGGTGGLGTAMCEKLAAAGVTVVAGYYKSSDADDARAQEWVSAMNAKGYTNVDVIAGDVGNWESCVALGDALKAKYGSVDIVVNNAGITQDKMFLKMTPEQWNAVLNTNLNSLFNVTKQFLDGMVAKGWGRVINISSVNGEKGQAGQTNYSSAKAGILGFTKALAQEVCTKGVTVNAITPGYIGTEMVMKIREDILKSIVDSVPMKRIGKPEEIGAAVAYLASDDAAFMTGATLSINGGLHMY